MFYNCLISHWIIARFIAYKTSDIFMCYRDIFLLRMNNENIFLYQGLHRIPFIYDSQSHTAPYPWLSDIYEDQ